MNKNNKKELNNDKNTIRTFKSLEKYIVLDYKYSNGIVKSINKLSKHADCEYKSFEHKKIV